MNKKELIKRYAVLIIGLFFSGVGVAFTKHGELGVSPISSVANILSMKFTFLTLGGWLFLWNCVMIAMQVVILKKDFKPYQFLQIPLSFVFGWFTDIGVFLVSFIPVSSYPSRILMLLTGIILVGFGVALNVIADVIMNAGDAAVRVIAAKSGREFGNVKVAFDISCVSASLIMSLAFFNMRILGIREGTIISALCTGQVVRFFTGRLRPAVERFISNQ